MSEMNEDWDKRTIQEKLRDLLLQRFPKKPLGMTELYNRKIMAEFKQKSFFVQMVQP
jgi:hypothetical protein